MYAIFLVFVNWEFGKTKSRKLMIMLGKMFETIRQTRLDTVNIVTEELRTDTGP